MGINVDNLFARDSNPDALLDHLGTLLRRKLVASAPKAGWVQLVVAGEDSPPEVARKLSILSQTDVVCAQLYEGSGDAGWAHYRNGDEVERFYSDSLNDPSGAVTAALARLGVPFSVRQFRELVVLKGEGVKTRAPRA